jgi:hypothetical protein
LWLVVLLGVVVLVSVILAVGIFVSWGRKVKGRGEREVDDIVELREVRCRGVNKEEERRIA